MRISRRIWSLGCILSNSLFSILPFLIFSNRIEFDLSVLDLIDSFNSGLIRFFKFPIDVRTGIHSLRCQGVDSLIWTCWELISLIKVFLTDGTKLISSFPDAPFLFSNLWWNSSKLDKFTLIFGFFNSFASQFSASVCVDFFASKMFRESLEHSTFIFWLSNRPVFRLFLIITLLALKKPRLLPI